MTTVILLNGVGSSGKTSIARELQLIASRPFLHVQMDQFLDLLPEVYQDHPDGISYAVVVRNSEREVAISVGPIGERLLGGMRRAVAALASAGNDLIVDDVIISEELDEYRALLAGFDFHVVAIHARLDVLESRERKRGDRMAGLARWQFDRVHKNKRYDFEVDTSTVSAANCAALIKTRFGL